MARTIRITAVHLFDDDGVGPVRGTVEADVVSDDVGDVALGSQKKHDARPCYLPRVAYNALVGALHRPNTDNYPDNTAGVPAHPVAKDP